MWGVYSLCEILYTLTSPVGRCLLPFLLSIVAASSEVFSSQHFQKSQMPSTTCFISFFWPEQHYWVLLWLGVRELNYSTCHVTGRAPIRAGQTHTVESIPQQSNRSPSQGPFPADVKEQEELMWPHNSAAGIRKLKNKNSWRRKDFFMANVLESTHSHYWLQSITSLAWFATCTDIGIVTH